MRSEQGKDSRGLIAEIQKRLADVALQRMQQECETDFQILSRFRTEAVGRFLAWIRTIEKSQRLEASLGITCHHLHLRHVTHRSVPNYQRWAAQYGASPLNAGLDRQWKAKRYTKTIASLAGIRLGPLRKLGPQSLVLAEGNPLAIPGIRTGIELNTRVADVVLLQFVPGDQGLFDLSYVSLLGLGQTGWRVYQQDQCEGVVAQVPEFISMARDLLESGV